jgi:non-ribosomal peptide synthetase component F
MGFQRVARVLQREHITVALMVPSVLTFLERYFDEIRLPDLRVSQFCGEALPTRLARGWQACAPHARLFNVYGPTEATIYCTSFALPVDDRADWSHNGVVSIGTPLSGTSLRIVDEQLAEVADGETGELVILGPQVTDQYWNNPERTSAAFARLPDGATGYRTGDLAFWRAGLIHYAGRLDFQLKIDGYRVEAGEIEHHARGIAGVRDAVLLGISNDRGTTVLHLFVLTDHADQGGLAVTCRQQLSARVPPYMVPAKVHLRSTFPLNTNGKVDRKLLAASLAQ